MVHLDWNGFNVIWIFDFESTHSMCDIIKIKPHRLANIANNDPIQYPSERTTN